MDFRRLDLENVNEYICRLGLLRKKESISWSDLIEPILQEFGIELTSNAIRKRYRRCIKGYITPENVEQKIFDNKELYRLQSERNQLNNYYRTLSREETIKDIGIECARIIAERYDFSFPEKVEKYNDTEVSAILLIGDWHYGIEIDSSYNRYNIDIAKERVQKLYNKVYDLCTINSVSKLYVINLGDMIAGSIHLPIRLHSQIDVMTQILNVSEIIANLLHNLSLIVNKVEYYSTLDNHSRIDANKKDSIQLETLARITPWFLKERFKNRLDVSINDNDRFTKDIVSFKINNFNILAVHGDKDKPQQAVDRLTAFTGEHQDLICTAHYHHFSCDEQNRTLLISNGSLMGTDEYAMDLRLDSNPSQTMLIIGDDQVCKSINKLDLS